VRTILSLPSPSISFFLVIVVFFESPFSFADCLKNFCFSFPFFFIFQKKSTLLCSIKAPSGPSFRHADPWRKPCLYIRFFHFPSLDRELRPLICTFSPPFRFTPHCGKANVPTQLIVCHIFGGQPVFCWSFSYLASIFSPNSQTMPSVRTVTLLSLTPSSFWPRSFATSPQRFRTPPQPITTTLLCPLWDPRTISSQFLDGELFTPVPQQEVPPKRPGYDPGSWAAIPLFQS